MEDTLTVILGGLHFTSKPLQSMDMKADKGTWTKCVAFSMLPALKPNLFSQLVMHAIQKSVL